MANQTNSQKLSFNLDLRLVVVALVLVIAGMLAMWRPWEGVSDRTIEVGGQATISAVPDEYLFYPVYEFTNADKQKALAELTSKSNDLVAKLKELGVSDSQIKTNSDGYDYPYYKETDGNPIYSLRLTVTINDKDLAQKVQDYLITTAPTGGVSPQVGFSEAKRKELEGQARDQATKDARAKAEQSAKNLGFSIGAVKSVTDGAGFGGPIYSLDAAGREAASPSSLSLQPGENDLSYSVSVVYFVR